MIQFLCTYLTKGHCDSVFSKILLTVISRPLKNEIAQFFYNRYIVLEKTLVQLVCTYLARAQCNSVFQKFF